MPAWSDEYLLDLRARAEIELTTDVHCLFDRFSIDVESGRAIYTLPEGIASIIQITYKGYKVDPWDFELAKSAGIHYDPYTDTKAGRPTFYLQHNLGRREIAFWPVPDETIAANDVGIWDDTAVISQRVIISCWRVADADHALPDCLTRRFVKDYVGMKAYAKEGPMQQTDVAAWYREKYFQDRAQLQLAVGKIPRVAVGQFEPQYPVKHSPYRPTLPINFGRKV